MVIIGVTGNAGGGKSAAISYLQDKGVDAVSADSINASLLKHSQSLVLSIEKTLQHQQTGDDGRLNIDRLRELVFSSKKARKTLERILHPVIIENIDLQLALLAEKSYCIIEVPLLFEAGLTSKFEKIILITADSETLVHRLTSRTGISDANAKAILNNQLGDSKKLMFTDDIVLNIGTEADLHEALDMVHNRNI